MLIVGGLDIETTSKLAIGQRIIEVCLQKWEFDTTTFQKKYLGTQTWRCNPEKNIDAKAQAVHGISLADLAHEPKREVVFKALQKALKDVDLIVAHNGDDFDKPFLEMDFKSVGMTFPEKKWFDTMTNGRWATPFGKVPNLGELSYATGTDYDKTKAHAAEYDVTCMMKAFFKAYKMGFYVL